MAEKIVEGNCRLAIQDYIFSVCNKYLAPEQILLPEGYLKTGRFITKDYLVDPSLYEVGDIVYAERIRGGSLNAIERGRQTYATDDNWIISLHTAVFTGDKQIYHATSVEGKTCVWDMDKFQRYYRIVAVKRIITR